MSHVLSIFLPGAWKCGQRRSFVSDLLCHVSLKNVKGITRTSMHKSYLAQQDVTGTVTETLPCTYNLDTLCKWYFYYNIAHSV